MFIYSFSLQYVLLVAFRSLSFSIVLTLVYPILTTHVLPVLQRSIFYPALSTAILPVFQLQLVQDSSTPQFTPAKFCSWLHHSLKPIHLVYIMLIYSFSLQYVLFLSIKSLPFKKILTLVYLILITPVLPVLQRSVFYPVLSTAVLPVFHLQLVQDSIPPQFIPPEN